jgi:hypothetical protein
MRQCAWLLIGAVVAGGSLGAQAADSLLRPGTQVRVWSAARSYESKAGPIVALVADSLVVRLRPGSSGTTAPQQVRLALSEIDRLDARVPTGKTIGKGGRRGMLFGSLIGASSSHRWISVTLPLP